jgi:Zinc-ribbon
LLRVTDKHVHNIKRCALLIHCIQVLCHDCEAYTTVPYHFCYHKCGACGSYNTRVEEQTQGAAPKLDLDDETSESETAATETAQSETAANVTGVTAMEL